MPPAWLFGKRFRQQYAFALEAQWWSTERAQAYQLARLREILALAYENTSYYRSSFESVGFTPGDLKTLEDVRRLPVIDKHVISENSCDMLTRPSSACDVAVVSTGGTSGEPFRFYIDAFLSSTEYAYLTASWKRSGYRLSSPTAVLRGQRVSEDKTGLRHAFDPILRHHYYSSFHMSEEDMKRYLEHMAQIGSCFMHVYPSTIATLARFMRRNQVKAPENVQGIIAESEIVYPEQQQMVEEVFGCFYVSSYGHSEKAVLAAQCEHSHDYHVWPTYGFFELLDKNGSPVTRAGQRGEIVGTGFMNTAMPFIRYRTGDFATYVSDRCEACGREQTIIRDIRGHRTQEMLVASDGSEMSWTALNMHDDTFLNVRQFQFMQEEPGHAILKIVPGIGFTDDAAERICRNLGRKLNGQLTLRTELVDEIALSIRAKTIYVDQRIQRKHEGARGKLDAGRREDMRM